MPINYKKKYLKYKLKYLEQKYNESSNFKGGQADITSRINTLLDKNKIDSDNLNTLLDNSKKNNILLIIYSNDCIHCTTLINECGEILVNHEESNNIKFLDRQDLSTDLNNKLEITGFPTILKINHKSTYENILREKYIGDRNVVSLIRFLKDE